MAIDEGLDASTVGNVPGGVAGGGGLGVVGGGGLGIVGGGRLSVVWVATVGNTEVIWVWQHEDGVGISTK